uniref:Uncharacterized protein n=1 Tax=Anguilla anguilla TaxID=7936 RepID=A0A0E9WEX0_ANGAN
MSFFLRLHESVHLFIYKPFVAFEDLTPTNTREQSRLNEH